MKSLKSHEWWDCLLKGMALWVGILAVLVLLSFGLELYALQFHEHVGVAGFLLLLFLASWVAVLVIASVAFIPVWLLVRAKTRCQPRPASSQADASRRARMRHAA